MKHNLRKNIILEGRVIDLTSKGEGVVKIDNFPFFVEGTIPGEVIKFKTILLKKNFGIGRLEEIIEASPDRVEIKDDIGRQIGTMSLQHMTYPRQLEYKHDVVEAAFQRIGHFEDVEIRPTLGMAHPWEYRNKAQIPVREIDGLLSTGFFRRNSHDLIPVEDFYIQDPVIDETLIKVRDILRDLGLPAYNEEKHSGLIRHIIVKRGHYTGQIMIILVTNKAELPRESELVERIVAEVPELVSLMQNVQPKRTNVIIGQDQRVLWGQDYYEDQMLGLTYRISAKSFFQVNTTQAETLYRTAIEAADLQGTETVLDAYSGIGSISLSLAQHAGHVYAMEIVEEAVDMARVNAEVNGVDNVTFEAGPADEWLAKWQEQGIHFDVAVVDPPRKGLDGDFIETLLELAPDKIVYVSCNPATQARDVRIMTDGGYELQFVQPVDLFSQTPHTESCALLTKISATT